MDRIRIRGGKPLHGTIPIGGAKNAALPLMAAALLTEQTLQIANVPDLADITTMLDLLQSHGMGVETCEDNGSNGGRTVTLEGSRITRTTADYELVRKMRASVLVMGPLLSRFGEARVSLPGGCAIGTRPVNLHLDGLERLGAKIEIEDGYIHARAPKGLSGALVRFPSVSVGATENLMMAAALADGETVLENAALEPEVIDLARCLVTMGAEINGAGTACIRIQGRQKLGGGEHSVIPDRIEAATYAMAGAITGGEVRLRGIDGSLMGEVLKAIEVAGAAVVVEPDELIVMRNGPLRAVEVTTAPFPGFPTDAQAQMMALVATADGTSMLTEAIFENRFMHVPELVRMGADISVRGNRATVQGVPVLRGAQVMATDLRASVSLVLAGLIADGETTVNRIYHLDRGYERLVEKLAACGVEIERIYA